MWPFSGHQALKDYWKINQGTKGLMKSQSVELVGYFPWCYSSIKTQIWMQLISLEKSCIEVLGKKETQNDFFKFVTNKDILYFCLFVCLFLHEVIAA